MVVLIALGLLIVFVTVACVHLICAQYEPDDLHNMGVGR
jgi:hypothetical protein